MTNCFNCVSTLLKISLALLLIIFNTSSNKTFSQCGAGETSVIFSFDGTIPTNGAGGGGTGNIQTWTVPTDINFVTISALGAQGGSNASFSGGNGAQNKGTFAVTPGDVLHILVGGVGGDAPNTDACGGGGGSFVSNGPMATGTLLIAGAGGGGASANAGGSGLGSSGFTGTGGSGFIGGGGAGFMGDGADGTFGSACGGGGIAITTSGNGGSDSCESSGGGGYGGGGSGGKDSSFYGGGGGGGYDGGSGGGLASGGGGRSWNTGTNPDNISGTNSGAGEVSFCYSDCLAPDIPTMTSAPGIICDGNAALITISGAKNDATEWKVYTGSCGGTLITSISGSTFIVTPDPPSTTYFIRGEGGCVIPGGCGSITVTTTPREDATFYYDAAAYCVDAVDPSPTITGIAGGTFSSDSGLSINSSTGVIDVSASTPGLHNVTYNTSGLCDGSEDFLITINALDNANFSYDAAAYCEDDSDPTPMISGLAGGTFSSGVGLLINGSTGAVDVSDSTPGIYSITYSTSGICPSSSIVSVTINVLDDASFSYDAAAYCEDDSDPTPMISGLAGGTFSSGAGLSINASTGAVDVSDSTPGIYSIAYTTSGTCPNISSVPITINALDDANFSYDAAAYCENDSDPTPMISGLAGGTFSSGVGLSINASTGTVDVSDSTPGIYSIAYTTSGTCPNISSVSVTIIESTDADGDGHYTIGSCLAPADDCDDDNNMVYPGAPELCDGLDNNCDNQTDEGQIISAISSNVLCDDNSTPSDPSDDTFTFEVIVSGNNSSNSWTTNDPNNTTGMYNGTVVFGPYSISSGDLMFTITDDDHGCTTDLSVAAPMTCSDQCEISATFTNVQCNSNGTPSDDTDDTYTFEVTVIGSNTSSSWSASDLNSTTGGYNTAITFGPYDISDGDLVITITDDIDGGCTTLINVLSPSTCSNTCSISNSVSNIMCQDNGTPSDPSDDTYTFEVVVTGLNISTGWTADDANTESGFYGISNEFGPFAISGGTASFTITDDADPVCTTIVTVNPPMTCSNQCDINATNTTPICDDNSTPSDASDDTYTFDVTVTGSNTGSSWTSNDPNSTSGSYGTSTTFGPYAISDGDISFTITDGTDSGCTESMIIFAPMTCSDMCDISATNTTPVCDDNGTPSDASDDTYTFDVTVTGSNTGSSWTSNDPNGTTGGYDTSITFGPYSISGGGLSFMISDDVDGSCTTMTLNISAPITCSDLCDIAATSTTPLCDDNGTPSDPSDDTFSFDATLMGSNTGSGWTATDPNSSSGSYNMNTTFGPYNISGGDLSFSVIDNVDPACTDNVSIVAPMTCSDQCDILATFTNVQCNSNGTPSDDTDDTYTFEVTATGSNTGTSWSASDPNSTTGGYNASVTFGPYNISDGDLVITITDDIDGGCTTLINVVAPSTCSNTCSISNSVSNILCNDNSTPSDPSDDTYTFEVVVTGLNISTGWTADDANIENGFYGISNEFGPFAISGGAVSFTITDDADPVCTTIVTVSPPMTCSDQCDISATNSTPTCNDNGTPSDASDDTYTFDVTVTGSNTGSSWTSNDPNGTSGSYGSSTSFGPYAISDGDINFTITDGTDSGCTESMMISAPITCSDMCDISATDTAPICDDNGTPSDASDDIFTFEVTVTGSNTGSSWTANDPSGTTGGYNTSVTFGPYNISGGDISFTITDDVDGNCTTSTFNISAPMTCSDLCDISVTSTTPLCDDNGTPSDPNDDTFTFDATIIGNNTGSGWTATDPNSTAGSYNTSTSFGPYNISGSDLSFSVIDNVDPACTDNVSIVAPMTCSDQCNISATFTNVQCNSNGTPSDDTDDTYTFEVTATGSNTGTGWSASDPNSTTGGYNASVTFGPYNISDGDLVITISDEIDGGCTTLINVVAPSTCSNTCSISNSVSDIMCLDNGTPSDPSDDIYTFEVIVTGLNISTGWTADDENMESGFYGISNVFGPFAISGGAVSFTITDDADPVCTTIVTVSPPMTCSDQCDISATSTSPICDDNDTPSDANDDTYTFQVTVTGSNTGSSWIANDPNGTSGSYGSSVTFGPYDISDGDVNFTINDGTDSGCTESMMITAPMTCSDLCDISATNTATICNDNGTPSDPSDDTYTFSVTVTGSNTGTAWTANDPNGTTGGYNSSTTFGPYNISGGDFSFAISDDVDGSCTTMTLNINAPIACSDLCDISATSTTPVCADNGTPSDPSDDTFTFEGTVMGSNTGSGWTATDPNTTAGSYNSATIFGPYVISGGDLSFSITDNVDPACTDNVNIMAPMTCSDQCDISATFTNVQCNSNGTPSDDTDDTYTFEVTVTGSNTGSSWAASDLNSTTGGYNTAITFGPYNISDGDLVITISDEVDGGCTTLINVVAPSTCSNTCSISNSVSDIMCQNNGTPSDPSDDVFTFEVVVTGLNISTGWTADDANTESGFFGISNEFGPFAISGGAVSFTITDDGEPACTSNVTVSPPMTCSDLCDISAINTTPVCDDNGTPSDPDDDTYTFEVTVSGSNTGSSWTANDLNATSGSYGSSTNFGPYNISDGDINFTITDGTDSGCTESMMINAPMACSDMCDISATNTMPVCDDNGTPSDASDDTYSFEVTVVGTNNGSGWTANDPNGTTGIYNSSTIFGPYNTSGGDLSFTITDDVDGSCATMILNISAPMTCSDLCDIAATSTTPLCDDSGTPSDPSDDTFTFETIVTGSNTGSGWTATDPNTTAGSYNSATSFGPYNITGGDLTFSVTDNVDPACTDNVNITAPMTCSDQCNITATVSNVLCDDNGTISDSDDDTYTFDILVTGINAGMTWFLDDANSSNGNYDETVTIGPYNIVDGNLTLIVTDIDDESCTDNIIVQVPNTCSGTCSISNSTSNYLCNDNGTSSDPSDDTFTFDVVISGSNTGSTWINNMSGMGAYDDVVNLGPFLISDGSFNIVFEDIDDLSCTTVAEIIPPVSCSDDCEIFTSIVSISCDDNGTTSDPSDDLYFVEIVVSGSNTGSSWISDDSNNTGGSYGASVVFGPYLIMDGGESFTVSDLNDPSCISLIEIDAPLSCSQACEISISLNGIFCQSNGTDSDPLDDIFTIEIEVSGINNSSEWESNDIIGSTGAYDIPQILGPYNIMDGTFELIINDIVNSECIASFNVEPPETCSDLCDLEVEISNIICSDNDTPSLPSDDTFSFDLWVDGLNTSNGWIATDPNNSTGSYNSITTISNIAINGGDLNFMVSDEDYLTCNAMVNVEAPESCSDLCAIEFAASNILCDDNGTPNEPEDDTYTFDLLVTGDNTSSNWYADDINNTNGNYNSQVTFGPYLIVDGNLNITIRDSENESCQESGVVQTPMPCSSTCSIASTISEITCDNNGTPTNPDDDTFNFEVIIVGSNTGSGWEDNFGNFGEYGVVSVIGPFQISEGGFNIIFTDQSDEDCISVYSITPPETCSDQCQITANVLDVFCDDNGTDSNPTDDMYYSEIEIDGINVSSSWTATDPNLSSGGYGTILLGPYLIADGDLTFEIIDGQDNLCVTEINLAVPNTCSDGLCNINVDILSFSCENMNTSGDTSDDETYVDIIVNSDSGGSGWTINSPNTFQGSYNSTTTIGPFSYVGEFTISIIDNDNPDCNSTFPINTSEIVDNVSTDEYLQYCELENALELEAVGMNLVWFDSSGDELSSAPIPNTSILGVQNYSVIQTVDGCESGLTSVAVEVFNIPVPPIVADVNYCIGDEAVSLTAIGDNLFWYDADMQELTVAPLPQTQDEGMFEYFVSSNTNGCESELALITVVVEPCGCANPLVIENIESDSDLYCLGQTIVLSVDLNQSDIAGVWKVNSGGMGLFADANTHETEYYPSETGFYMFEFESDDPDGEQGACSAVVGVVMVEVVSADISVEYEILQPDCDQDFGSLTVNSITGGTSSYTLELVGTELSELSELEPDEYTLQIIDSEGCTADFDFTISEFLDTNVNISAGSDTCVIAGETIQLLAKGGVSYEWVDNGAFLNSPSGASPEVRLFEETTFTVTIITENGCTYEDDVHVCINENPYAMMKPISLITPNGDGKNDVLLFENLETFPNNRLRIFNRWGAIIFDRRSYQNDGNLFNGSRQSGELSADTYYYILEVDNKIVFKSDLTILRD